MCVWAWGMCQGAWCAHTCAATQEVCAHTFALLHMCTDTCTCRFVSQCAHVDTGTSVHSDTRLCTRLHQSVCVCAATRLACHRGVCTLTRGRANTLCMHQHKSMSTLGCPHVFAPPHECTDVGMCVSTRTVAVTQTLVPPHPRPDTPVCPSWVCPGARRSMHTRVLRCGCPRPGPGRNPLQQHFAVQTSAGGLSRRWGDGTGHGGNTGD